MSKKNKKENTTKSGEATVTKKESRNIKGCVGFIFGVINVLLAALMLWLAALFAYNIDGQMVTQEYADTIVSAFGALLFCEVVLAVGSLIMLVLSIAGRRQLKTWRFYRLSAWGIALNALSLTVLLGLIFTMNGISLGTFHLMVLTE